jgi:chromosome segregation ATPase
MIETYEEMGRAVTVFVGAILAAGIGLNVLFRKTAKNWNLTRVENDGLAVVMAWREEARQQRERADRAYEERNAAVAELAQLRERASQLAMRVVELTRVIEKLEGRISDLEARLDKRGA